MSAFQKEKIRLNKRKIQKTYTYIYIKKTKIQKYKQNFVGIFVF